MHKRKQVKPNFMIAVRMWSIYKILSWRDWLSLRSHTDDLQMLFLYSFVEEEGILVLHGIFRFGGCHEISLLKSLHACQKFIWFFKCNTTSMSHSYALSVELLCNLLRAEASWPCFPGHNLRTDPLLSFAGPGTRLQRRCWSQASTGVRRVRQCFLIDEISAVLSDTGAWDKRKNQ